MKIAYFGSPEISRTLLSKLLEEIPIVLILTQPDKLAGRRLEMTATPVKRYAIEQKIEYFDRSLSNPENQELAKKLLLDRGVELCIVFAYGQIVDRQLLSVPKFGFWNIHPSLLPKYRGPSPLIYPLIMGDDKTGITLMQMDDGLDHGDIITQVTIPIEPVSTKASIIAQVIENSATMIKSTLKTLKQTKKMIPTIPQNHDQATYTRLLKKQDGYIELETLRLAISNPDAKMSTNISDLIDSYRKKYRPEDQGSLSLGITLWNLFRGLAEWPGLWTVIPTATGHKRLKIIEAVYENHLFIPRIVQLEGKKEVNFSTFNKAYNIF